MRLLSCSIAGFGRLKNLEIDFNKGLNAVQKENGWGKTTFAVFLEAMFFGMRNPGKRSLSIREHYRPWDGGVYGGSLSFEVSGRVFRIERLFGAKESEDEFAVYENDTLSDVFSSDIGRELFSIDRASFEKSLYFPQNALGTSMTESLNAKMGDMAQVREDIDGFDAAVRRLEEAKLEITRNSKNDPGKLFAVAGEIRKKSEAYAERPAVADALEKQKAVLEEKRFALSELKKEKEALLEVMAGQSEQQQALGVYSEKKEVSSRLQAELEELKAFFAGGMPSTKLLDEMSERERALQVDRTHLDAVLSRLPSEEEGEKLFSLFQNRDISEQLLGEWEEKANEIKSLRIKCEHASMSEEEKEQLAELAAYFEKRNPTDTEIEEALADAALLAQFEGQVETLDERYRNTRARSSAFRTPASDEQKPKGTVYAAIAVAALFVGSFAFGGFLGGALGWTMAILCAGLGIAVLGVMIAEERKRRAAEEGRSETIFKELMEAKEALESKRKERDAQKEKCKAFLSGFLVSPADTYTQMIGEIQRKKEAFTRLTAREEQTMAANSDTLEALSALQVELYVVLSPLAGIYRMNLDERHEEGELIERLKEDKRRFDALCENLEEKERLERSIWKAENKLFRFLDRFPLSESDEVGELSEAAAMQPADRLAKIRAKQGKIKEYESRLEELRRDIKEFEKHHNIDEETRSIAALAEEQAGVDAQISEISSQLRKAQELESELSDRLEELDEVAESLEALSQMESEYKEKAARYDRTIAYLNRAKEQFLSRYMGALTGGLARYLQIMDIELSSGKRGAPAFSLDLDLGVCINRAGGLKEAEYFSEGFKDIVSFCTRLALIDALYQQEAPFLIMDDPFANLDDHKVEKALGLLKKMSSRRQVIYFTCLAGRMP